VGKSFINGGFSIATTHNFWILKMQLETVLAGGFNSHQQKHTGKQVWFAITSK
jgi:hypothetical protein